ncbi:MAG: questin oxidase family protein [Polyangiaceae bacterium]
MTRRSLLLDVGIAGALAAVGCRTSHETPKAENPGAAGSGALHSGTAASESAAPRVERPTDDVLDEALERLAGRGPAYSGALANHAPMVAEALVTLGRGDAVASWIDTYAPRLEAWPRSAGRIAKDGWRDALGKSERATDFREFFAEELANAPFRDVLAVWVPRLGAGISGSAAHGVIRVAHVTRALSARDTAPRRRELAAGLAYWASTFHRLPDEPRESAKLSVERAIDRLEMVPANRRGSGSIVDRLAPLSQMPSFANASDLVAFDADLAATLAEITRAFARVYCANAGDRDGRIARLHAVTGASAVRPILPYLPPSSHRALVRYVWQLDAAVYATHATRGASAPAIEPFSSSADLVAAAVDTRDEHAIKLTEVALREDAIARDSAFQLAAAHWVRVNLPA